MVFINCYLITNDKSNAAFMQNSSMQSKCLIGDDQDWSWSPITLLRHVSLCLNRIINLYILVTCFHQLMTITFINQENRGCVLPLPSDHINMMEDGEHLSSKRVDKAHYTCVTALTHLLLPCISNFVLFLCLFIYKLKVSYIQQLYM